MVVIDIDRHGNADPSNDRPLSAPLTISANIANSIMVAQESADDNGKT